MSLATTSFHAGEFKTAAIASAATTDLSTVAAFNASITGTAAITSFGTTANLWRRCIAAGAFTITYNATTLITPTAADIVAAAGDTFEVVTDGFGNARVVNYQRASGLVLGSAPITNALSGAVALNNTANFFDGPSIAQGSTGTWFASGTVSLIDTAGAAAFEIKLWDGTTVIGSTLVNSVGANVWVTAALSGLITSPAGNIRISVKDTSSTSGFIYHSGFGAGKDSMLTAFRLG